VIELAGSDLSALSTPPASATAGRPWRLRTTDRLLDRLWVKGLAPRPSLDPEVLIDTAGARALPDRTGWRRRLAILCGDLEQTARLTPLGHTIAHGQIVAALRDRVRMERLWSRYPAILDHPIAPPIIIVGQMRSGTTRVQRLLACDPRLTTSSFFESWNPVPRSARRGGFDDRAWRARVGLAMARMLNPEFATIHPTAWNAPDEQIGWHAPSFFGSIYDTQWRVPAYTAEVENGDAVPVYQEFRRLLQTVTWLRGESGARPWVLKIPQFAQDLDALLAVFPDARILRLDRDPLAVVASSASLVRNQMDLQSEAVRPSWIGQETLRKVALRERRTEAALSRTPVRCLRVDYAAVDADWREEIERIYRFLHMPLAPALTRAMAVLLRDAKRQRLERHRYELSEFGLTEQAVRAALTASKLAAV
jgi:hypothetical protein